MNAQRRKEIQAIIAAVTLLGTEITSLFTKTEAVAEDVNDIINDEQEYFDNMPECLQEGDKGEAANQAVQNLEGARVHLKELKNVLEQFDITAIVDCLNNAQNG
jgi:uncharacterized coiled-coil DUF342 family protein